MFQLAGWGDTEHGTPSDVLLLVDLPYVDHSHCINQVPEKDQRWVTSDQFCAGYGNGKVSTYFKLLRVILIPCLLYTSRCV